MYMVPCSPKLFIRKNNLHQFIQIHIFYRRILYLNWSKPYNFYANLASHHTRSLPPDSTLAAVKSAVPFTVLTRWKILR